MLRAARANYRAQRALSARAAREATALWRRLDPDDLRRSWRPLLAALTATVTAAQLLAAARADGYVTAALLEQDLDPAARGELNPTAFAGIASDGRPLDTLLDEPLIATLTALSRGWDLAPALAGGLAGLTRIVGTQVADAGRTAESVALVARPAAGGWVRMLELPSCERCAVLAGKFFRWNQGFARHPRCLPAGVVVSGPAVDAATRRWYEGELVVITTASGQQLPITGNHPVLTDRGWLPAHLVEEGSHVVSGSRGQGAGALTVPDEDQVPARVEDLWRADGMVSLGQVPTAAEDFHGDGGYGEVDVVLADRLLRDRTHSSLVQLAHQEQLAGRVAQSTRLAFLRTPEERVERLLRAANGGMGASGLLSSFLGALPAGSDLAGAGHAANDRASRFESLPDRGARDAVAPAEAVLAFACGVGGDEIIDRQQVFATRWDPPAGPFTVQSRAAYADRGHDLRLRLTSQVALDRVVKVERVEWSGHVYNLTSTEGWYSANGMIVSNCDCRHIPTSENLAGDLTTDPRKAIESGQVRGLSEADTRAILDGADVGQVINAKRGMSTAEMAGRRLKVTSEGMTKRGVAGRQLRRFERDVAPGQRYRRSQVPRLRPESIYREAADREDALRLLRRFGYLT